MHQARADYWYNQAKEFIQTQVIDENLNQNVKNRIAKRYTSLTPANAEYVYAEVSGMVSSYHRENFKRMQFIMTKFCGAAILIGVLILWLSHFITKWTNSSNMIHKCATYGISMGQLILALGFFFLCVANIKD